MRTVSLLLGLASTLAGVLPLFTMLGPATLKAAALGLPLGALGVGISILSRQRGPGEGAPRPAALVFIIGMVGTLLCAGWMAGLFYAQSRLHDAAREVESR